MTPHQRFTVIRLLHELVPTELHHGDCVGADADFADLCCEVVPKPLVVAHPGESARGGENKLRAFSTRNNEVRPVQTHFARNRTIVAECDVLIACPATAHDPGQGGTWYTISHAQKMRRKGWIVRPDGTTEEL